MSQLIFTRQALRELDRRAVEEFHIPILVLMENAGRAVADAAHKLLKPPAGILIVAGPGNNGGDGLVAARWLHNAGYKIEILLVGDEPDSGPTAAQLAIVRAMNIPLEHASDASELRDWLVDAQPSDLIIDALFGTGLARDVTGLPRKIIDALNACKHPILAIDLPSGLDPDSGLPLAAAVHASHTVSMCGLKPAFLTPTGKQFAGKITTADIGAPASLLHSLGQPLS